MSTRTIPLDAVIIREDLYPRMATDPAVIQRYQETLELLPPIEVNQNTILIDGRHRWTAHKAAGAERIAVTITETASDAELLLLACKRNATHGFQLSSADKRRIAQRTYETAANADRASVKKRLAQSLSVTPRTINNWVRNIDLSRQAELRQRAFDMWLACHTQEAIGKALNMSQQSVSDMAKGFTEIGKLSKIGKIAAEYGDFEPELYDVFPPAKKSDGNAEPILENLLSAYTEPFDVVVDPFAAGGSTIDVCKRRYRRYFVSDLTPIVARETEIRRHDVIHALPPIHRWQDVRLVYLAPPELGSSSKGLAAASIDGYNAAVEGIINRFAVKLPSGAKIALLIAPTQITPTQWLTDKYEYVDHLTGICKSVGLPIVQRLQCPFTPDHITDELLAWGKDNKVFISLQRDLVIWEVC